METLPRCRTHAGIQTMPPLCLTCHRIDVERQIVERTVDALLARGFYLNHNNGGTDTELARPTRDRAAILAALMETDEEHVFAFIEAEGGRLRPVGWVSFVYGNGTGAEVIGDYSLTLAEDLRAVERFAEALECDGS